MLGPDQDPWLELPRPSTTGGDKPGKIKRPRRAKVAGRRQATPHRLASRYGPRTPVTMTVTIRTGADMWAEVVTDQGRFFVAFDASVFSLVQAVIKGGHTVEPLSTNLARTHRSGVAHLHSGGVELRVCGACEGRCGHEGCEHVAPRPG